MTRSIAYRRTRRIRRASHAIQRCLIDFKTLRKRSPSRLTLPFLFSLLRSGPLQTRYEQEGSPSEDERLGFSHGAERLLIDAGEVEWIVD